MKQIEDIVMTNINLSTDEDIVDRFLTFLDIFIVIVILLVICLLYYEFWGKKHDKKKSVYQDINISDDIAVPIIIQIIKNFYNSGFFSGYSELQILWKGAHLYIYIGTENGPKYYCEMKERGQIDKDSFYSLIREDYEIGVFQKALLGFNVHLEEYDFCTLDGDIYLKYPGAKYSYFDEIERRCIAEGLEYTLRDDGFYMYIT